MSMKILGLYSWPSAILLIFLLGRIQISNAYTYCQYYKEGQLLPYMKQCPNTCCLNNRFPTENTTCCNPPIAYTTTTVTLFGYSWWTIFVCAICFFTALSILIHFSKRIRISRHWKHFNSTIGPASAFTISKKEMANNPVCYYSAQGDAIILEDNPPSYASAIPPPSYASVNPSTKTVSE